MYTVRIFMKCTHVCSAQNAYQLFTTLLIKPDVPYLEDEIAEPRPDMKFKVTAFIVSEKSSTTCNYHSLKYLKYLTDFSKNLVRIE